MMMVMMMRSLILHFYFERFLLNSNFVTLNLLFEIPNLFQVVSHYDSDFENNL